MLTIWGTKTREECLGAVADWCNACRDVRPFWVTKYYQVAHLARVQLGSGKLVAGARRCWSCNTQVSCDPDHYEAFLSQESVGQLSLDQFLRRTNGRLVHYLETQRQDLLPGRLPSLADFSID